MLELTVTTYTRIQCFFILFWKDCKVMKNDMVTPPVLVALPLESSRWIVTSSAPATIGIPMSKSLATATVRFTSEKTCLTGEHQ